MLLILIAGCDNFKKYELEVVMPQLPDHVRNSFGDIRFDLKYPGSASSIKTAGPGSSVNIYSSAPVFPVVATPYIYLDSENPNDKEYIPFYSAGGIFPESGKDGSLLLKWEDGFAAEIIYKMVNNGYNVESFNIGRFKNYLIERSLGNPWIYDEENIIYALSFNIFNANFVKKKNSRRIVLQLPLVSERKEWVLSNLADPRIFEKNNGILILDDIPERNVFILSNTGKEFAELFMDSTGWHAYFSNSEDILSGRW